MQGTWTPEGKRALYADPANAPGTGIDSFECDVQARADRLILMFAMDPPSLEVGEIGRLTSEEHTGRVRIDEVEDVEQDRRGSRRAVVSVMHDP